MYLAGFLSLERVADRAARISQNEVVFEKELALLVGVNLRVGGICMESKTGFDI
jgi:hypothetical protein